MHHQYREENIYDSNNKKTMNINYEFYTGGEMLVNYKRVSQQELLEKYPVLGYPFGVMKRTGSTEDGYVLHEVADLNVLCVMYNVDKSIFTTKQAQLDEINRIISL